MTRKMIEELIDVLEEAEAHLDYCGYGDSWERECAVSSKLPEKITSTLSKAKKLLGEDK